MYKGEGFIKKGDDNVEDEQIIDLYFKRDELAISETDAKYGKYCFVIANNILSSKEDSKECVNDTYLRAWNSIPPKKPGVLKTFLGKITRNLSLNLYEKQNAQKRGSGCLPDVIDELDYCVPSNFNIDDLIDGKELENLLNKFLGELSAESRKIFMQRYWYISPVSEIAKRFGMGESKVKMSLLRSRDKLRKILEKEGVSL